MALAHLDLQPTQAHEISLPLDPDLISELNAWRLARIPVQSPTEAIVSLIRIGLDVSKGATGPAPRPAPTPEASSADPVVAALISHFQHVLGQTKSR